MSCYDSPEAIAHRGRDYAAAIDRCHGRYEAADLYADGLQTYGPDGVDWRQVNGAILRKWTPSGLEWIKRRAWRIARATGGDDA